jgi:hypothetical protein
MCQAIFVERDGRHDEVLHKHAWWRLFTTRPKPCEGVSHLVVTPEDMMKFKTIEVLLKLSYLLVVCHHAGIMTI